MYYNGIYHEFYQYNPHGSNSPSLSYNIVRGHSVSTDLVNWIGLEPVLVPDTPSDICGCWTGSATILPGNQPVIIYTGLVNMEKHQVQNIALPKNRSDPYLREWTKAGNNPVIQSAVPGLNSSQFRDPTTGWIGPDGLWRIAVGADMNGHSTALLYKSEDFLNWTRVEHPLYFREVTVDWTSSRYCPGTPIPSTCGSAWTSSRYCREVTVDWTCLQQSQMAPSMSSKWAWITVTST